MLVLTRNEGTAIYGGFGLTEDLDGTFEHKIEIVELGDKDWRRYALIRIVWPNGRIRTVRLDGFTDSHAINSDVSIYLLGVSVKKHEGMRFFQSRIGVMAPSNYRVVRHDAIKKVA